MAKRRLLLAFVDVVVAVLSCPTGPTVAVDSAIDELSAIPVYTRIEAPRPTADGSVAVYPGKLVLAVTRGSIGTVRAVTIYTFIGAAVVFDMAVRSEPVLRAVALGSSINDDTSSVVEAGIVETGA